MAQCGYGSFLLREKMNVDDEAKQWAAESRFRDDDYDEPSRSQQLFHSSE